MADRAVKAQPQLGSCDAPPRTAAESRTRQAIRAHRQALREQRLAETCESARDPIGAHLYRADSARSAARASQLIQPGSPPAIAHGEVIPDENPHHAWMLKDTLAAPDTPAIDASIARTELLLSESFDVAALAIDAANSIPNATSLEKALAHQAALCHKAAFEITAKAMTLAQRIGSSRPAHIEQAASVETTRLLNAAARMMSAYQQALLTLQRLRHGGEQRVLVQHVNVGAGGQAVVGAIRTGGCQPEGGKRK